MSSLNGFPFFLPFSHRVLLRVRLLYYLRQEVIGESAEKILSGCELVDAGLNVPATDGEPPATWWDDAADKSLLVGVFKHGYEKYNAIRSDPKLVFLARCGPPDEKALMAEENDDNIEG